LNSPNLHGNKKSRFMINLSDLTHATNVLVLQVGDFIREQRKTFQTTDIKTKSLNSLVSYVDVEAEKMLVEGLRKMLPEADFITEEETVSQQQSELFWVIDPLDGTTNFMHGLPIYAISIALMKNNEVLLGVIYEIAHDELFYAWQGGGAYLNQKKIQVSNEENLSNTLLATGFPYHDFSKMPQYMMLLQDCFRQTRGMRRLGSAATDLAYVAAGRFDGFFEYGLAPWDVAAGVIIVIEAGGFACDFSGGDDCVFGKEILAGGANIKSGLFDMVKNRLG